MGALAGLWAALSSRAGQVVAAVVAALGVLFAVHRSGERKAEDRAKAGAAAAEFGTPRTWHWPPRVGG